jgi:hypothetical protein
MFLKPAQKEVILAYLNDIERVEEFITFNATHSDRDEWIRMENHSGDTSYSRFRRESVEWLDKQLSNLQRDQLFSRNEVDSDARLHSFIRATDFFFYSGEDPSVLSPHNRLSWLLSAELPVAAYKVFDSVFSFSFSEKTWSVRYWLDEEEPLLSMPYSRKYDYERIEMAQSREKRDFERVMRAIDFVNILLKRIGDVDLQKVEDFKIPDFGDIGEEMSEDNLGISLCSLMGMGGRIHFDLLDLETDTSFPPLAWHERKPKSGPPIAEGEYSGVLNQTRMHSGASLKKMSMVALWNLVDSAYSVCYTPEAEEMAEIEEEKDVIRDALGIPRKQKVEVALTDE